MEHVWIDIEDNENCGYFPMQTFEAHGEPEVAASVEVDHLPGVDGPQEIVGWCSDNGGAPCDVSVVLIGDSGAGESRIVKGGDHGVRIRRAGMQTPWSLESPEERGDPYVLLSADAAYRLKPR